MARNDDHTGRNVALVAGGGALLWWLLRGRGGLGLGGVGRSAGAAATHTVQPARAHVRVDADGIAVDGQRTDIGGAVALVAGRPVDLLATGAARMGTVEDLKAALQAAGVEVWIVGGGHA